MHLLCTSCNEPFNTRTKDEKNAPGTKRKYCKIWELSVPNSPELTAFHSHPGLEKVRYCMLLRCSNGQSGGRVSIGKTSGRWLRRMSCESSSPSHSKLELIPCGCELRVVMSDQVVVRISHINNSWEEKEKSRSIRHLL